MRTIYSPGTLVTTKWLNGSQNISFNGADEDWSYPKLTPRSLNLPAMGTEFLRLSSDQGIDGLKTFAVLPQSDQSAVSPNDFLTLKDVKNEESGFLRVFCSDPRGGNIPIFNASEDQWECSAGIDGGEY